MSPHAPIACTTCEEELLAREPSDVARVLAGDGPAPIASHLQSCASCAALAADLASFTAFAEAPRVGPAPAVFERTFLAAAAEGTRVAAERRRRIFVAAGKATAAFVLSLPIVAACNGGIAAAGARWLPEAALPFAAGLFGAGLLAGLTAVAFLLVLVSGAAARPPADELAEA